MKPKFPLLLVFALMALFVGFLRSQEVSTPPAIDSSKLFIVDSTKSGFALITVTPNYRVYVGDWFVMNGRELADRSTQNVTFSADVFAPEFVRIELKREPVVRKKDDGTWEITFKEVKP